MKTNKSESESKVCRSNRLSLEKMGLLIVPSGESLEGSKTSDFDCYSSISSSATPIVGYGKNITDFVLKNNLPDVYVWNFFFNEDKAVMKKPMHTWQNVKSFFLANHSETTINGLVMIEFPSNNNSASLEMSVWAWDSREKQIIQCYRVSSDETFSENQSSEDESSKSNPSNSPNNKENKENVLIGFLIDRSGSMVSNDPGTERGKWAKKFIETLSRERKTNLWMSYVEFNDGLHNKFNLQKVWTPGVNEPIVHDNPMEAFSMLDGYLGNLAAEVDGTTNILASLNWTIKEFDSFEKQIKKRGEQVTSKNIFLLTDGLHNFPEQEGFIENARRVYENRGISVWAIGFGSGADKDALSTIAAETNGKYFNSEESLKLDLEEFFTYIAQSHFKQINDYELTVGDVIIVEKDNP